MTPKEMGSPAERFESGKGPGRFSFRNLSLAFAEQLGEKRRQNWSGGQMPWSSQAKREESLLVAIGLKSPDGLEGITSDFNTSKEEKWGPEGSRDFMIWRPSARRRGGLMD